MANNNSLKDIICDNLTKTLSVDKNVRYNAEQQLIMLETNEDYGLHLMEISLSENLDFSIRHLSSVLLNQYIKKHWNQHSEKFEPPEIPLPVKQLIKEYLLKSLMISTTSEENVRRLLNSFAHSISSIAQNDWPGQWPQLFPTLNQYLSSGSPTSIYSSLKVFKELSHEITDTQIPNVAPILLPQMLNIFVSKNFSIRTRSNAIKIFGIISETIFMMNDLHGNSVKLYLEEYIPKFTESAIGVLMTNDTSDDVDIGMKKEIITIMTKFLRYCPKQMKQYLPKILGLIWQHLTTSANIYVKTKVNSFSYNGDGDHTIQESVDSDGESIGFDSFIYTLIDFVNSLFEFGKYRALIKPVLSDLLYYILYFVQITDEQAEKWQNNLDQLIEEDDVDTVSFSIRIAAQDLILNLAKEMTTTNEKSAPKKDDPIFKLAFLQAIQRHFSEASELEKRQKSSSNTTTNDQPPQTWWKIVESCLYCMGLLAPTIIYTINNGHPTANDYKTILDNVLMNLNVSESFMAGRSLWTASRFSPIMNDQSLDNFLKFTSTLLNTMEAPILRVYALRATFYFFLNVQLNQRVSVIKPYMNQFLQGLVSIGMNCNSDTLDLVLQIVDMLLELDKDFTCSTSQIICSLLISTLFRFPDDANTMDSVLCILDRLYAIPQCFQETRERLLPIIVAILNSQFQDPHLTNLCFNLKLTSQNLSILQPQILDILTKTIDRPDGCNECLVQKTYPTLMNCLNKASKDDTAILQNGCECLCAFLKRGSEFVVQFIDPNTNQNGIILALNVCIVLLQPQIPDSACTCVGRVIVVLIMKCNHIIGHDNIQHLLRSTLVRLNTSKQLPTTQSLILVFAHLIYTDFSTIMLFLNSLPAPDGTKSALEFVLNKWLGIQRYFYGYEGKASSVALCRLFQHALQYQQQQATNSNVNQKINNNGSGGGADINLINLNQILVSCDDEFDSNQTSRTRSQTKNNNSTRLVPCTVKMLKLLINELIHINELKEEMKNDFDDEEEDDEDFSDDDEEDDDANDHQQQDELNLSSNLHQKINKPSIKPVIDLTDYSFADADNPTQQDYTQEEILCDEIDKLDLENVLKTLLKEFRQQLSTINNGQFFNHLTANEATILEQL